MLHADLCSQVKVRESEEGIAKHENFHHALLNMEKWLMIMRQKLESFCSPSGHWSVEGRQHEAEVRECVHPRVWVCEVSLRDLRGACLHRT